MRQEPDVESRELRRKLRLQVRDRAQGGREALEVARIRATGIHLLDETLEIAHAREERTLARERGTVVDERPDGVETGVDIGGTRERARDPVTHRPRTHRRLRDVEHPEERRVLGDVAARK